MEKRAGELRNVTLQSFHEVKYAWFDPGMEESFNVVENYGNRETSREGLGERRIDWLPWILGICYRVREVDGDRSKGMHFADIAFATVSSPDSEGFCSFGVDPWNAPTMLRTAKVSVVTINPKLVVRAFGDKIHLDKVDYIVEADPSEVGASLPPSLGFLPPPDEAEMAGVIGTHVSTLIRDGDTLEVGTGTGSEAVWKFLQNHKDLGVDTEIISPTVIDVVKAGIITGKRKNINKGKVICSLLVGHLDEPRYIDSINFVKENPMFEFHDICWIDNLCRMAENDNMVSVNNLLSIDLYGQGVITHLNLTPITGPGGQVEYVIAPHYSRGGRSISVLLSTARGGTVSRIVPRLSPGAVVMVPMVYIDWLVTEHGIVNLNNKSLRQRAEAICSVAYSSFRSELMKEAKKMFWPYTLECHTGLWQKAETI